MKMKSFTWIIACLLLAMSGRADDHAPQPYASRYESWSPHISSSLAVTIQVGARPRGLSSASFSAHLRRAEPAAMRPDGTPVTAHAVVTTREMEAVLKLIDDMGAFARFTTCGDDDWRAPDGQPTRAQVVWRPEGQGYTYDWYVLPPGKLRELLQELRASVQTEGAVETIHELIEGLNSRQK